MMDGKWLSPGPLSRGGDILPVRIEVTKSGSATPGSAVEVTEAK